MTSAESEKQDAPRRNRPEAIGWSTTLGQQAFTRAGFANPTLVLRWREIVGPETARLAQPLKLSDAGVLTLKAEPAAATFLQHQSRGLCERINTYLGRSAVQRLRFVPGPIEAPARAVRSQKPAAVPSHDPAHSFCGADTLKTALLGLARARGRHAPD